MNDVTKINDHAEMIEGALVVTDKTSTAHNNAVLEISTALRRFTVINNGKSIVFAGNVALYCDELCDDTGNLFLPDVMSVYNDTGVREDGVHIAPVFVVEVTSEHTKKNDYIWKMKTYSHIGVKEYWVVDLERKTIFRYLSKNDYAPEVIVYPHDDKISVQTYPPLEIDLSRIFE